MSLALAVDRFTCSLSGCDRKHYCKGLCQAHYTRVRRTGGTGPTEVNAKTCSPPRTGCAVADCQRRHHADGLCDPHYRRARRAGSTDDLGQVATPGPRRTGCDVDECERPHRAKGYCNYHYERQRLYREPKAGTCSELGTSPRLSPRLGPPRPQGGRTLAVVGYHGAHARLRKARGKASAQTCQHCDQPARDWAYTNDDPRELVEAKGRPEEGRRYSLDPDRYIPLCKSCHNMFDGIAPSLTARWGA